MCSLSSPIYTLTTICLFHCSVRMGQNGPKLTLKLYPEDMFTLKLLILFAKFEYTDTVKKKGKNSAHLTWLVDMSSN